MARSRASGSIGDPQKLPFEIPASSDVAKQLLIKCRAALLGAGISPEVGQIWPDVTQCCWPQVVNLDNNVADQSCRPHVGRPGHTSAKLWPSSVKIGRSWPSLATSANIDHTCGQVLAKLGQNFGPCPTHCGRCRPGVGQYLAVAGQLWWSLAKLWRTWVHLGQHVSGIDHAWSNSAVPEPFGISKGKVFFFPRRSQPHDHVFATNTQRKITTRTAP